MVNRPNTIAQAMLVILFIALICTLTALQSCRSSLLFSPTINAPSAPITSGQGQLYGGATMLVETRPQIVGQNNQIGSEVGVRYGFSNQVSAQAKWWNTLGGQLDVWGASGSIQIQVSDETSKSRFAIQPAFGTVVSGNSIEGVGTMLSGIYWFDTKAMLSPYISISPMYGWRVGGSNREHGVGSAGGVGVTYKLSRTFSINGELNGVVFHNFFDRITVGSLSPSLMFMVAL
jgi:hypothetical protein